MRTEVLLRQLARLDHSERVATLVAHARELPTEQAQALARELWSGDGHQRMLALVVAEQCDDMQLIWRALEDPARSLRGCAAKLIGRLAQTIPVTLLDTLDTLTLGRVYMQVARHGRAELAEVLVDGLIARERFIEATRLLCVCSTEAVAARLDHPWPDGVWCRVARYHPALLAARIEERFTTDVARPDLIWREFDAGVWRELARAQPATLADWVDRFADADSLPPALHAALPWLVCWSPERVVAWLSSRIAWTCANGLPRGLTKRAVRLDDATLVPLCQGLAATAPARLGELVSGMPHVRRGRLFELAVAPLELARIEWPTTLLALLPLSLRDREAARMLELRRAQTDGSWRRTLLGLRWIELARPLLELEGRSAQASERAEAHLALIHSSAGSREGMPQTLAWLQRTRNEQDPVRLAVLSGLAEIPATRFDDPAALDAVLAPIFEARDTSWATRQKAARVAQRLLCAHATEPGSPLFSLGVSILERLAGHGGTLDLPRLDHNLPRGAERAIVAVLMPWIEAAAKREQETHLVRLWTALGKRAWRVPELGAALGELIWHGHKRNAGHAAQRWIEDPETRDVRVRELVKRDRSALYLHAVLEHCLRRRQALLVDRLASPAPRGRFHDGKVVVVPMISDERLFGRWTTALQRQYLDLIDAAEASPKQFSQTRAALVAMRARVPLTRVDDLQAALASTDVNLQEAALGALVWLDDAAPALPILLEHLDGDRARVAMYAMPRLARLVPRDRFVDAIGQLLARPRLKVTVHKEALRLLGQLATGPALALLRASWAQPLHRDVRIAALHAARAVPSQADAWAILNDAARDPEPDIARAVVEVALASVPAVYRPRYLEVMGAVADHASPIARAGLFTALYGGWSSVAPARATELGARVVGRIDPLDSAGPTDPWRQAAQVVAQGARSPETHSTCAALLDRLIAAAELDVAPAGELDQAAHQRLRGLLDALIIDRHPTSLQLLERLAAPLLARPRWWLLGARLKLAAAANGALGSTLLELVAAAPTARAALLLDGPVGEAARTSARAWTDDEVTALIDQLITSEANARILALPLLRELGPRSGWSAPFTARLARLREDPDLDVRTAALELWTS
ncbi:hypothetical protein [Enhygromyxa salina]|uniref:HEAT repeat protein n=1 Tax=Enhygromyxa salina TaxID=215803 RepID=A0A2S9YIP5_9BACT|nr:hypothetical protein [Enhygromyxa salina]PRQ04988.1 hypothetical protein ENSA7_49210 [Enhygromyxa salina]